MIIDIDTKLRLIFIWGFLTLNISGVREILVLSFIVSEKNRKKDGRCIGAST
jgi:hypothetical protein